MFQNWQRNTNYFLKFLSSFFQRLANEDLWKLEKYHLDYYRGTSATSIFTRANMFPFSTLFVVASSTPTSSTARTLSVEVGRRTASSSARVVSVLFAVRGYYWYCNENKTLRYFVSDQVRVRCRKIVPHWWGLYVVDSLAKAEPRVKLEPYIWWSFWISGQRTRERYLTRLDWSGFSQPFCFYTVISPRQAGA